MSAPGRAGASHRAAPTSAPEGPGAQAVALSPSPTGGSKQGAPGAVAPRGVSVGPLGPPRPVDMVTVDTKSHCRTGVPALSPEVFRSPSASPVLHLGTLGPSLTPCSTPKQPCASPLPGGTQASSDGWVSSVSWAADGLGALGMSACGRHPGAFLHAGPTQLQALALLSALVAFASL